MKKNAIALLLVMVAFSHSLLAQSEQITFSISNQNLYSSKVSTPGSAYLQLGRSGITNGALAPCLVRGLTQSGSSLILEGCNASGPQQVSDISVATSTILGPHGEQSSNGYSTELITLSTSSVTSASVATLLPANSFIKSVVCYITTTITGSANWKIGDGTTTGRFIATNTTLTAGTRVVGIVHRSPTISTDAAGAMQPAAAALVVTTNANATAGAMRCTVFWETYTAPTS